ncbi:hypothetical protein O3G_MSEX012048, partial [Manduca sexta]
MGQDYYLQPPRTQLFYTILGHISTIFGTCQMEWWGPQYKISKWLAWLYFLQRHSVRTFGKVVCLSQSVFMVLNFNTLSSSVLIVILTITPVGYLVAVKAETAKLKSYEKVMKAFMDKIHIYNCYVRNKDSEYVKTKVKQVEFLSRFTTWFLTFFLYICWSAWMLQPTLYNIRNIDAILNKTQDFQYYIYLWTPLEYHHNLRNYLIIHTVCVYLGVTAITVIITFDCLNMIIVYHIVGHIYILKHNFRTKLADDFTDEKAKEFLVDTIKYHSFIITTFKNVQNAFGINVAANYLQNLFEDGLCLYQMMKGDMENFVKYGLMLVIYLGSLIMLSVVLEEIKRQNSDLSEVVYSIPWQRMSVSNQKTVMLLLFRTQPDLEFRAACGMKAGVQPALSIIKSMFSYYVMIKSR